MKRTFGSLVIEEIPTEYYFEAIRCYGAMIYPRIRSSEIPKLYSYMRIHAESHKSLPPSNWTPFSPQMREHRQLRSLWPEDLDTIFPATI